MFGCGTFGLGKKRSDQDRPTDGGQILFGQDSEKTKFLSPLGPN